MEIINSFLISVFSENIKTMEIEVYSDYDYKEFIDKAVLDIEYTNKERKKIEHCITTNEGEEIEIEFEYQICKNYYQYIEGLINFYEFHKKDENLILNDYKIMKNQIEILFNDKNEDTLKDAIEIDSLIINNIKKEKEKFIIQSNKIESNIIDNENLNNNSQKNMNWNKNIFNIFYLINIQLLFYFITNTFNFDFLSFMNNIYFFVWFFLKNDLKKFYELNIYLVSLIISIIFKIFWIILNIHNFSNKYIDNGSLLIFRNLSIIFVLINIFIDLLIFYWFMNLKKRGFLIPMYYYKN